MARRPNYRLVKIHRSYTVEEAASRCGVHRNTVRQWLKRGLPTVDDQRPQLILGRRLVEFLRNERRRNRRACGPGEMFCMRCRVPRRSAGNVADYDPLAATFGNLIGLCSECESVMCRRVSTSRFADACGDLEVRELPRRKHIAETAEPSVDSDFGSAGDHASTPR